MRHTQRECVQSEATRERVRGNEREKGGECVRETTTKERQGERETTKERDNKQRETTRESGGRERLGERGNK